MATVLTVMNRVLRRLRKSTINSITGDTYAELLADLLTEAKAEVENAHDWQNLQGTVLMDTVANTYRYKLQGVYENSKIKRVYDQTNDSYLIHSPKYVDEGLRLATPETGTPTYWDYVGYNDGELLIDVWPVPNVDDIRLYWHGKYVQGDIGYADPDTTHLSTPTLPLVLGTLYRAIEERGEDDGESLAEIMVKYDKALGDAIALDNITQGDNLDWTDDSIEVPILYK